MKVGLAGTLADFTFVDRFGNTVRAEDVPYHDQRAGYTADPQEIINYVEAHDNETLFDAIQLKAAASATIADRIRMQTVGLSLVVLGQGVPFIHAGRAPPLGSRSTETPTTPATGSIGSTSRTSPTTGAWACRPHATTKATGRSFGHSSRTRRSGQPPRTSERRWTGSASCSRCKSSRLFRLRTAAEVEQRLTFRNSGPSQIPGLIVMELSDAPAPDLDPAAEAIIVFFNATDEEQLVTYPDLRGRHFTLHRTSGRPTTSSPMLPSSCPAKGDSACLRGRRRSSSRTDPPST